MTMPTAFWVVMLVWLVCGFWWNYSNPQWPLLGGNLLLFILLGLLGWHAFGPPIH